MIRRTILFIAAAQIISSCVTHKEITLDSVDGFEIVEMSNTGIDAIVTLRATNGYKTKISAKNARAEVIHQGAKIARISANEKITLLPNGSNEYRIPLRIRFSQNGREVLTGFIRNEIIPELTIGIDFTGRKGIFSKKIHLEKTITTEELEKIMEDSGVNLEEIL